MEILIVLFTLGLVAFIFFMPLGGQRPEEKEVDSPIQTTVQERFQAAPQRIVEATENVVEMPDGRVISVRNVRQWN